MNEYCSIFGSAPDANVLHSFKTKDAQGWIILSWTDEDTLRMMVEDTRSELCSVMIPVPKDALVNATDNCIKSYTVLVYNIYFDIDSKYTGNVVLSYCSEKDDYLDGVGLSYNSSVVIENNAELKTTIYGRKVNDKLIVNKKDYDRLSKENKSILQTYVAKNEITLLVVTSEIIMSDKSIEYGLIIK